MLHLPVVAALPVLLITGLTPPSRSADSLRSRIEERISRINGAVVGVVLRELGTGASLEINPDSSFHAASTMKVPVMIELFRRVDAGSLRLDQGILLINRFASIVDGSPYSLDPGEDSDSAMYKQIGQRVPVRDLI